MTHRGLKKCPNCGEWKPWTEAAPDGTCASCQHPSNPEDMSVEEIIRTAVAGDPKLLKVPEKGLMPPERKNTSRYLRHMASTQLSGGSQEDREDARHFEHLAARNDVGLLTPKEAQEIADILEEENSAIVDLGTERWVETD